MQSCFNTAVLVRAWLHRLQQVGGFKPAPRKRIPRVTLRASLVFIPSRCRQHIHGQGHCCSVLDVQPVGIASTATSARGDRWAQDSQELPGATLKYFPCLHQINCGPPCTLSGCQSWQAFILSSAKKRGQEGSAVCLSVGGHGWYQFYSLSTPDPELFWRFLAPSVCCGAVGPRCCKCPLSLHSSSAHSLHYMAFERSLPAQPILWFYDMSTSAELHSAVLCWGLFYHQILGVNSCAPRKLQDVSRRGTSSLGALLKGDALAPW